jgi:hypothetical protein
MKSESTVFPQKINAVRFEGDKMIVQLEHKELAIDLTEFPNKLLEAGDFERAQYEVSPSGYGIHWPLIDEDISLEKWICIEH